MKCTVASGTCIEWMQQTEIFKYESDFYEGIIEFIKIIVLKRSSYRQNIPDVGKVTLERSFFKCWIKCMDASVTSNDWMLQTEIFKCEFDLNAGVVDFIKINVLDRSEFRQTISHSLLESLFLKLVYLYSE